MNNLLEKLELDYLLVNSTNEYLVEYSLLEENARYTLTGFSGSTGDALVTKDKIYLFVDGRYHIQAEEEVFDNITVVKLQLGQNQDDEIRKILDKNKVLGIVAKKVSQARLEKFKGYKVKLLENDPINNFTKTHLQECTRVFPEILFDTKNPMFITNLEEVSYLSGLRDFSCENSSKIWAKLYCCEGKYKLFFTSSDVEEFLSSYQGKLQIDKNSISAYDYSLILNPIHKNSLVKTMKAIKTQGEINAYKKAFVATDNAVKSVRDYINNNDCLSEYDIAEKLKEEFYKNGAKTTSFSPIVAINKNSALAHYNKNSKEIFLNDGDLVLIDCGAYFDSGLATDITRVFVKGTPTKLQQKVYTQVLKAFLNTFNSDWGTGFELDNLAHEILDDSIEGFVFNHGLGHGIGINVHESPPSLNKGEVAKSKIEDNMTFTIEPGLYNSQYFGIRLENSCYKNGGKTYSFVKMGYEGKLIDFNLLTKQEKIWLKEFEIL